MASPRTIEIIGTIENPLPLVSLENETHENVTSITSNSNNHLNHHQRQPSANLTIGSRLEKLQLIPNHSTLPKDSLLSPSPPSSTLPPLVKQKSATLTPTTGNKINHNSTSTNNDNANSTATATADSTTTNTNGSSSSTSSSTKNHFSRNNIRRSFTLPRSLLLKNKTGHNNQAHGPASENNSSSFVRNIFLTFVRSGSKRNLKKASGASSMTNGEFVGGGGGGGGGSVVTNGNESQLDEQKNNETTNGIGQQQSLALPPGFIPAAIGLKNQGNTCFMNAIVQCLSHTDVLAKYLVTDAYKNDLRKKYWIKNGKGEVTEELASILKSTWLRMNSTILEDAASRFKSAVERGSSQFKGSEQQDAQEFLLWILNKLHEDLNQATSNKFKPVKSNVGRPDEQVAAEALANHYRLNNSIIHELFAAHSRSSLTCPGCGIQSATFEPFLGVALPIPQPKQEVPVYVNIVYLSQQPRLVKLGLNVSSVADIKELKQLLATDTGIEEDNILLCEIDGEGFHRTFTETQLVSVLANNDAIYCIESPELKEINENDGAFLMITWTNILVNSDGSTRVRFGSPYITQIGRETGFKDLQKILLKEMAGIIQPGILVNEQKEPVFSVRILDGSAEGSLIDPEVEHPLYMEAIDHALSLCDEDVPSHIKLHLEWVQENKTRIIADDSESVEEHLSVVQIRQKYSEEAIHTVTLGECFDLYTKAEQLSEDNSYHCPHCNRKEQGTFMIGLWTAPQVLVVHLKRFRHALKSRQTVTKISSLVDFPIEGLDLYPHVSKRNQINENNIGDRNHASMNSQASSPMNGCFGIGSWKRASFKKHLAAAHQRSNGYTPSGIGFTTNGFNNISTDETDNGGGVGNNPGLVYDLFAVCNHHGKDIQSGHYTAYCQNPVDYSWWSFDDTRVTQLPSVADVKTSSAYILFYQRRNPSNTRHVVHPTTNGNGLITNHWCRTLVKKQHKGALSLLNPLSSKPNSNPSTPVNNPDHNATKDKIDNIIPNGHAENDDDETSPPPPPHPLTNGYHNNTKTTTLSNSSSSGDEELLTTNYNNSKAPLARMDEIPLGLGLAIKDIQIESTV